MKISVPFDLPDSREGIYVHTLSIVYMETTCIHVTTVEWFYIIAILGHIHVPLFIGLNILKLEMTQANRVSN